MPRSLNRVTLLGHLGQDAEVKYTASGTAVANFSLATSRRWKDKQSGEYKEETDWHRIVFWRCENVSQYLIKGTAVLVEGRLQTRSYESHGEKRYVTEVVVDNLILLGGKGATKADDSFDPGPGDEDLPF